MRMRKRIAILFTGTYNIVNYLITQFNSGFNKTSVNSIKAINSSGITLQKCKDHGSNYDVRFR